jgi:hypothetical protein
MPAIDKHDVNGVVPPGTVEQHRVAREHVDFVLNGTADEIQ